MTAIRQGACEQVDQFLSALFLPEELIELRFIESWLSDGKRQSRVVRAAKWVHRADVIAMHTGLTAFARRTRANVYFGVCPRPRHGDADDGSIKTVRCIWCDICELLRLGLSKDEIWEVVSGSSKFETAGRPYFELTITNAERTVGLEGTTAFRSRTSV